MNRTKVIYFLSAIVLIIGCFALNESYSLFIDSKSNSILNTTVPTIDSKVTLSLTSVDVEGTKEYLIKQTITNNNNTPVNFGIYASSDSTTYKVQAISYEDETYLSYGTVLANETKDIYLVISNTSEDNNDIATINFSVKYDYATLKFDSETYLANANIDNETMYEITIASGGIPYSDNTDTLVYKLIEQQMTKYDSTIENKTIELNDLFASSVNKLSLPLEKMYDELNVTELSTVTDIETTEVGLYKTEDDYGTSYFYRGTVKNNYVSFAGFIWRIVRINGDGSIRLILDGTLDLVKNTNESDYVYKNSALYELDTDGLIEFKSSPYNDNGYVGYMYGNFSTNSTSYDEAHANINNSTIKTYIDTFYEQYIKTYQEGYLADTLFCADKTRSSGYTTLGYGKNTTYYGAYDRLYKSTTSSTPTLKCVDRSEIADTNLTEEQLAYSRYTSIIDSTTTTNKGVLVNNDLTYPIGLISADELVMSGAFNTKTNTTYYLYDAYKYTEKTLNAYWWTITPYYYNNEYAIEFYSLATDSSLNSSNVQNTNGVRPVINLKLDVLWESGDGTQDNPYTVKLNEEA